MDALVALVRKDLVQYFSNKRALAITLAAPVLIAAFFGSVTGGTPKKPSQVPVAVVDLDRSPVSTAIVAAMRADTAFALREVDEAGALALVGKGQVRAAAVFPRGFGDAAPKAMFSPVAAKPEVVVHFDPSQSMTLALVKGLLAEHVVKGVGRIGGKRSEEFSMPFTIRQQEAAGRVDRRYNAYSHSFAGMGVQFVLFMGIELGVGLLLMRRMGLWKRLRAAPVSRGLLLGSRVVSGTLIAAVLLLGIYAAGMLAFGVRIDGSVPGFVLVVLAFAVLTSSFGLLIAAVGRTPEATRGLAVLATLLLVMLGGAWVPTFVFPQWLQAATQFVPTRWAIDGLAAVTWRGLGLEAVMMPVAGMLACGALFTWIAAKRFGWEE